MLRIVMDTAGDLPEGWQESYDVDLIPINIIHNEKTYLQGIDLGYEDFYNLVEESDQIPTTSQPTPFQFEAFYEKIAQLGDTILSIHVTDKLSGTMASARQAAKDLKDKFNIIPFDSASGTICMGLMVKEARLMERAGKSIQAILDRLNFIRDNLQLVFTVDTLKFAQMSGRVKSLQAALVSMLNVKPIIELKNGIIEMKEKVRSRDKSLEKLIEKMKLKFGNTRVIAAVVHARDKVAGINLMQKVIENLNCEEIVFGELSISLAAHFGPGTLGIAAYPVK